MDPLTLDEFKIVTWVEQTWNITGKFPTVLELKDQFPEFNSKLLNKPVFMKAMENRGIGVPSKTEVAKGELSEEQLAAILSITDYHDKRTQSAKLRALGVSTVKWNGWMRDARFKHYVHNLSASVFDDAIHVAQMGLAKRLEAGDVNAAKFYMELTGRFNSGESTQLENLNLVIARLTEVLQIHIKDPDVLRLIYRDLDTALNGKQAQPEPISIESQI